ncbi:MAG: polyribonucleotide nucleotidyltransferase [Candidatus Portnoybacteria bacterium]|nr:polyribonucleotide nucleotidyltransferase [Candidatus Portnoybacteria bacterium]
MENKKFSLEIGGKKLKIEVNHLAGRANASVLVQLGETIVLATCVISKRPREEGAYMPLSVDYEERLYAAGKIKGSRFVKREGRPTDEAILTSRLIDRAIRPLFNQKIRNDIQVVATVLSYDGENDPDIPALNAASLALLISDIPWAGPVGGVRIGLSDQGPILNPTYSERTTSIVDAVIAGTEGKINMLEIKAKEIPEDQLISLFEFAQEHLQKLIVFQKEIQKTAGQEKIAVPTAEPSPETTVLVTEFSKNRLENALFDPQLETRIKQLDSFKDELFAYLVKTRPEIEKNKLIREADTIIEEQIDEIVHRNILQSESEKRPDNRKANQLRSISCQAGLLPRTHGSAFFARGETKALSIVTLGSPGKKQLLETMEIEGTKRFMHHYNFPPFSVGETSPLRGPGRREIGHGALTEKALEAVIPDEQDFPYTIRVVSEILSSNGSSSMASACASSLALMDAGVPIKKPVAGIAMGLMMDRKGYKILTDIQGAEDHHGDMDLKVAGTTEGITAIQMDVKIEGLTAKILNEALVQAKEARLEIIDEIKKILAQPRESLSPYAPVISTLQINPERIRDVIGPGGKIINQIIDETGVEIDIEDSGLIFITSQNKEGAEKAINWIKNITHEVKPGETFQGKVTRILDFGAMVEILPNQDGLVHISELAPYRVRKVSDIVKIGEIITVRVKNIDDLGRINLTLKNDYQ